MADFKTYDAGGPVGSSVTPKEGIASQGVSIALGGLGDMAQVGLSAFKYAQEANARSAVQERKDATNSVIGTFINSQLKIVEGYEQGEVSQAEARTRLRQGLTAATANNLALSDDIFQAHKDLMATAGLGKVVSEGTQKEQMYQKAAADAFSAGFGDGPEAVPRYLQFQRNRSILQDLQAEVNYRNSNLETEGKITSNASGKMALEDRVIVRQQEQATAAMADAFSGVVADNVKSIVSRLEAGEIDDKTAIAELNAQRLTITQTIGSKGRQLGSDHISLVTSPMIETIDFAKKAISGEEPLAALNNRIESNISRQKLIMTTDAENAKVVAVSEMFRNIQSLQANEINEAAKRMLGNSIDPSPTKDLPNPFTNDQKAAKGAFDVLRANLKEISAGRATPALIKEMDTSLTSILQGTNMYAGTVKDLKQVQAIQNLFSDPSFADYVRTKGGLPEEAVKGARDAVQQLYSDKVLPLVKTELEEARVQSGFKSTGKGMLGGEVQTEGALDAVSIRFSGSDVVFEGKGAAGQKAKELNQSLAPIMNKMIRVKSHLDGTTDYKAAYEYLFGEMVNGGKVNDTGNP